MRWNVEGADPATGAERVIQVDADDRDAAERVARERGLLVAAAYPSTLQPAAAAHGADVAVAIAAPRSFPKPVPHAGETGATPLEYHGPAAEAAPATGSPADESAPPPPAPAGRRAPRYVGLQVGSSVLMAFALLYYVAAGLVLLMTATALRARGWEDVAGPLLLALALGMVGGLLQALSAACLALRDIARNSFRA
jgi:hypothetical protein